LAAAGNTGAALPPLSVKHEAVAQAYWADPARVGWRAYAKVYRKSSRHASETAFGRLRSRPEFQARLEELKQATADLTVMSLLEVLQELSKLGRSSIKNCLVDGDTTADVVASLRDMSDEHAAAIQELTIETYMEGAGEDAREVKRLKLKMHDKRGPLSELRRHHEPDRHELSGKDGEPLEAPPPELSVLELARRIAFAMRLAQNEAKKPAPAKTPARQKKTARS
jgi:phage terminase small subunit